jgi:low affinity Fe/Cu permease
MADFFRQLAHRVTLAAGSWQFFIASVALILAWASSGPIFNFSDTWQLVVNTSTTILTYIIGILILLEANRQGRESKVVHDELLEHTRGARSWLVNLDEMSDEQVADIERRLRERARGGSRKTPSSKSATRGGTR